MTETPALGDLIRESRLALGYSLGQLATKVGRTAATVRSWERGEAVPNEESRTALELVLDINPGGLESLLPPAQPESAAAGDDSDETSGSDEASNDGDTDPDAPDPELSEDHAVDADGVESVDGEAPEASLEDAESDEQSDHEVSDDGEEAELDGSEPAPPVVPLVTEGVPPDDEEASLDDHTDDTDDTVEGVAAVTPFEVDPALVDEPTEAVVVPVVAAATGVATQTRSVVTVSEPKEPRTRNPLRVFFDPQKRWLYWVRALLTIVVAVVLLFVLVWAVGELFDALGQVLDSIEPTEVDDGEIDALGRLTALT
jgi:transcriptional regulator with XRE-family HTH domain